MQKKDKHIFELADCTRKLRFLRDRRSYNHGWIPIARSLPILKRDGRMLWRRATYLILTDASVPYMTSFKDKY